VFRAGTYSKRDSNVLPEFQRKRPSQKCNCLFSVKIKKLKDGCFQVYDLHSKHNHDLLEEDELAILPQNRFIPEIVQEKMLDLNSHGILSCSQIMLLIEKDFFPETAVTWTVRDVQNLLQKSARRNFEANDFINLLNAKSIEGWETVLDLNRETLRLSKVLWMPKTGKDIYRQFNDVLEIDATYKSNRFGMPLILLTAVDNHGLTNIIAGCLVANECFESYAWALKRFQV